MYGRIGYPVDAPTSMHHGMHAHLENELDAILLWKYKKKKPSEFNQTATICLNGQEIQFISHFLASCINETYYPITYRNNFQVTPAMVHRSGRCASAAGHSRTRTARKNSALHRSNPSSSTTQLLPRKW